MGSRAYFCLIVTLLAGCAGRAEYLRGRQQELEGDALGAYREYHEAYRLSGSSSHREARDLTGRKIAEQVRGEAARLERAGDLRPALAGMLRALEYDPDDQALVGDYLRVRERIQKLELLAERASQLRGTWEAYRAWRDLRREAVAIPEVFGRIAAAAVAAADHDLEDLSSRGTLPAGALPVGALPAGAGTAGGEPVLRLPAGRAALEALLAAWVDFSARLDEVFLEDAFDGDRSLLAERMAPQRERATNAVRLIRLALLTERESSRGDSLEAAGDHLGAARAYDTALLWWPERSDLRDACSRALVSGIEEASRAASAAMARGDWSRALTALERLERLQPGLELVQKRANRCRRELHALLVREGSGLRERGLAGNALIAFLRAKALDPATPGLDREIAVLEEALRDRLRDDVRVELPVAPAEDDNLDRALWLEDARSVVDDALRKRFPQAVSAGRKGTSGTPSSSSRRPLLLQVEDLDFEYRLGRKPAGLVESQFVVEFEEAPNPDLVQAREELGRSRTAVEEARRRAASADAASRSEATTLLLIAEGWERRMTSLVEGLQPTVPRPVWRTQIYPVLKAEAEIVLAARVRVDGKDSWIEVRTRVEDREVEGDASQGIPPDPAELPSRREALRELGPRLAERLADLAEARQRARELELVEEARERLDAEAYPEAVESLVTFLRAARQPDAQETRQAEELLRRLDVDPALLRTPLTPLLRAP